MSTNSHIQADWPVPRHVRAFTTTRGGPGVSLPPFDRFNLGLRCGDEPQHALRNRERLVSEFALPGAPQWLQQVHGTDVVRIDSPAVDSGSSPGRQAPVADAAVTEVSGTPLAILTADCLPVLLCNEDGSEIGAAHAGWRGLAAGMLEVTVRAMRSPPGSLLAWLGPAAGPQAYEIGAEVRAAFVDRDPGATAAFVATREEHWLVDLYALARRRLAAVGVTRVYGGTHCTISDQRRFYSHRRDQRTGRMATVILLERL